MVHPCQAMSELNEEVSAITTRADLVNFIEVLRADLITKPEKWENPTLESYLGALASWIGDMDGYYRNHGRDVPVAPTWKSIGEMLAAARVYE